MSVEEQRKPQRVFGRRKGRPLRVRKARLMEEFLPRVQIILPEGKKITPHILFDALPAPVWMEIGFGGGEHLAAQAKLHPDIHFIGCEPFVNGVASAIDHLEREAITNVRIYCDDARTMLDALPDSSIDRCFALFADPWPKARHAERRFIGTENLVRLARVLKPAGLLRLASDDAQLIEWMRERVAENPAFSSIHDSEEPPAEWVKTRYQEKAIAAGRVPVFMDYLKKASSAA